MIVYKPLLKLLIDHNMQKQDLVKNKLMSWGTVAKINKNEPISFAVLNKLCNYFKCQPADLLEHLPDETHDDTKP
ncbi:MAG: transcriptional regulator, family [Firmicutes bacterium]|nr:transcriptional regulator, family [Bacillota bacterium]